MFIQLHKPKSTGEIISLERRLYEVVQKEWDSQEPTGHSFAQQTQKDVSTICYMYVIYSRDNDYLFMLREQTEPAAFVWKLLSNWSRHDSLTFSGGLSRARAICWLDNKNQ